jgi:hypothetical protein
MCRRTIEGRQDRYLYGLDYILIRSCSAGTSARGKFTPNSSLANPGTPRAATTTLGLLHP